MNRTDEDSAECVRRIGPFEVFESATVRLDLLYLFARREETGNANAVVRTHDFKRIIKAKTPARPVTRDHQTSIGLHRDTDVTPLMTEELSPGLQQARPREKQQ